MCPMAFNLLKLDLFKLNGFIRLYALQWDYAVFQFLQLHKWFFLIKCISTLVKMIIEMTLDLVQLCKQLHSFCA